MRTDNDPTQYIAECSYLDVLGMLVDLTPEDDRDDRTGVGTKSVFGIDLRFDISNGRIPVISTKKVHIPSIKHELIWMLSGEKDISYLKENKVNIWDEWLVAGTERYNEEGKLVGGTSSSIYGESWRYWTDIRMMDVNDFNLLPEKDGEGRPEEPYEILAETTDGKLVAGRYIDQIKRVMWQIKNKPTSRRIIISGWNAARVGDVKLPPCHMTAQFYVSNGELSCRVYLRSNDWFLGTPFNIVQYAMLTHMFAKAAGLETGELIYSVGDCHLYSNHIEQAEIQLSRDILRENEPRIVFKEGSGSFTDPTTFTADMIDIEGYVSHPAIKAPIAV